MFGQRYLFVYVRINERNLTVVDDEKHLERICKTVQVILFHKHDDIDRDCFLSFSKTGKLTCSIPNKYFKNHILCTSLQLRGYFIINCLFSRNRIYSIDRFISWKYK